MKVHLIRKEALEDFALRNPQSRVPIAEWLSKIKYADWKLPSDIVGTFKTADLLGKSSHRVVLNIGGNNYRMICKYAFGEKQVHLFVCWIGTHSEYDAMNDRNQQYTITIY